MSVFAAARGVVGREGAAGFGQKALEPRRVQLVGVDRQPVADARRLEGLGSDDGAETGDARVQDVLRVAEAPLAPDRFEQLVRRKLAIRASEHEREQRARPSPSSFTGRPPERSSSAPRTANSSGRDAAERLLDPVTA